MKLVPSFVTALFMVGSVSLAASTIIEPVKKPIVPIQKATPVVNERVPAVSRSFRRRPLATPTKTTPTPKPTPKPTPMSTRTPIRHTYKPVPKPTPTYVAPGGVAACIRKYESGNNYQAQNPSSTASGAYQFLDSTWQSVTGLAGRAMNYSRATQDAAFWKLWNNGAGANQWVTSYRCT